MSKKRNYAVVSNEDDVTIEEIVAKEDNKFVATLKKVWKPLAIGAGVLTAGIIGAAIGKSSSQGYEDDYDFDEAVNDYADSDSSDEVTVEEF